MPNKLNRQELGDAIFDKLKERYEAKEQLIGPEAMRHHERIIMLSVIDQQWKDHLLTHGPPARRHRAARLRPARSAGGVQARVVRHVRSHDGALRGRDGPLPVPDAGDRGAAALLQQRVDGGAAIAMARPFRQTVSTGSRAAARRPRSTTWKRPSSAASGANWSRRAWPAPARWAPVQQVVRGDKVGRNDPCPCGSGKKYKKCCGA